MICLEPYPGLQGRTPTPAPQGFSSPPLNRAWGLGAASLALGLSEGCGPGVRGQSRCFSRACSRPWGLWEFSPRRALKGHGGAGVGVGEAESGGWRQKGHRLFVGELSKH